jgi:hypothetical protein
MTCCPGRSLSSFAVVLVLMAFMSGCGGSSSPSAPSSPAPSGPAPVPVDVVNMAGTWVGTFESPNLGAQQITLTVVQSANCVDGTWRSAAQDSRGAISGFAAKDSFTGQVSFERGQCSAVAEIAGTVASDTIQWTAETVRPFGSCADPLPQSIVLSLRRQ